MTITATTAATALTYAAIASAATSLVGTGVSMYGQMQQAQQARRTADYNAAIQRQNANINATMAQYQASANSTQAVAQANAQNANAAALDNQALAIQAQGREKARRMHEEQERLLSTTRATTAGSGVQNEGSPLLVLTQNAKLSELSIQDAAYETEMNSRAKQREADLQRYGAGFSMLDSAVQDYQGKAAEAGRRIGYQEADLTSMIGKSQAQAYQIGAATSLFSGLNDVAKTGMSWAGTTSQLKAMNIGRR